MPRGSRGSGLGYGGEASLCLPQGERGERLLVLFSLPLLVAEGLGIMADRNERAAAAVLCRGLLPCPCGSVVAESRGLDAEECMAMCAAEWDAAAMADSAGVAVLPHEVKATLWQAVAEDVPAEDMPQYVADAVGVGGCSRCLDCSLCVEASLSPLSSAWLAMSVAAPLDVPAEESAAAEAAAAAAFARSFEGSTDERAAAIVESVAFVMRAGRLSPAAAGDLAALNLRIAGLLVD